MIGSSLLEVSGNDLSARGTDAMAEALRNLAIGLLGRVALRLVNRVFGWIIAAWDGDIGHFLGKD